jgi:hypothetical protein
VVSCSLTLLLPRASIHGELQMLGFDVSEERREIIHFNATDHPTTEWSAQQLVKAFPFDSKGNMLLFSDPNKSSAKCCGPTIYGRERLGGLLRYYYLESAGVF